ncbi:hypothetical protein FRC01_000282 [Tulasnella sp. 417]|nr:hypothetical protein FRC01_000282 [Tulasnella sp. 417]
MPLVPRSIPIPTVQNPQPKSETDRSAPKFSAVAVAATVAVTPHEARLTPTFQRVDLQVRGTRHDKARSRAARILRFRVIPYRATHRTSHLPPSVVVFFDSAATGKMPSVPPPGVHDWLNSPAGQLYLRDQAQGSPHLSSPNPDVTAPPVAANLPSTTLPIHPPFTNQLPAPMSTSSINQPGADSASTLSHSQQLQSTSAPIANPPLIPPQTINRGADALAPANIVPQIQASSHGTPSHPGTGPHSQPAAYHHVQTPGVAQIHQPLQPHLQQAMWPQHTPPYVGSNLSSLSPTYFQQSHVVPSTLAAPSVYTPPPPSVPAAMPTPIEPYHGASGVAQFPPDYSYGSHNPAPARGLLALVRGTASAVNEDRMRSASSTRGLPRPRGRSQAISRPATQPYPRSRSGTPTQNTPSGPSLAHVGDFANIEVHIYIPLSDCDEYGFQFLRLRRFELQAQLSHYGAVINLPNLPVATTHLHQIMELAQQHAENGPYRWSFRRPSGPPNAVNPFATSVFDCLVPAVKAKNGGKEHALQPVSGGPHMTLQWILRDPQSPFVRHQQYSGMIRTDGSYWFTIRLITKSPDVTALILERPGRHHSCIAERMFNRMKTDTRKEDQEQAGPLTHDDPTLTSDEGEDEDGEETMNIAQPSNITRSTRSTARANIARAEQAQASLSQDDWATHSGQDFDDLPPLVPSSITVEGATDGLTSQPIPPFRNLGKIWSIVSSASSGHYPLAPDDDFAPPAARHFRLSGRNDAEVATLLWNAMVKAAEVDDCTLLLSPNRSYFSGPGVGFGIERQVLSLLARDKFSADRAEYWTPRRGEYYSPALSLPASLASSISPARLLEMKTLGILTGFHIALLGAAPSLYSPFHFYLAMHGNDPTSLTSTLVDRFDPQLRQLQDQWSQLPLHESPAPGSPLFYFIVQHFETPPQALANRSQAAHDAFATQMVLASYVGIDGMQHPEMEAFVSGLELPCENGLRLSHVIKAFRPTSVDALAKLWDTVPSDWASLSRDDRFRAMSANNDSRLSGLLQELREVTENPDADFKDYLETWLQGQGCMSIEILRNQISQGLFPPQFSEEDVMKPSFRVAMFYEVTTSSYRYIPGTTAKAIFVNDTDSNYDSNASSRLHNISQGVIRASTCFHQVYIPASALLNRLRADSHPPEGEHESVAASVEWFFTFGFANAFGRFTTA